jgi:hypothetical protein
VLYTLDEATIFYLTLQLTRCEARCVRPKGEATLTMNGIANAAQRFDTSLTSAANFASIVVSRPAARYFCSAANKSRPTQQTLDDTATRHARQPPIQGN